MRRFWAKENRRLDVFYKERLVGTLALTVDKKATFAYADSWLREGFSISPFSLPLKKQVFAHNRDDHSKNFTYIYDEKKDQWRPDFPKESVRRWLTG